MIFEYDYFQNVMIPHYVLRKASGDRIGILVCTEKKSSRKFNAYDEISFTTYMNMDGIKNEYYDLVKEGKFIEIPLIGEYVITDVNIQSEATDYEYKECTALSSEVLLAQKYVENKTINMGTTGSVDGVRFYHQTDPSKSLLHLLLEKCPDWEIGHVDVSLREKERCFEIDRQDVYGLLVNEVSEAFQCIFLFDTVHHRINVYEEKNVGEDTNIFVSYNNLLKNTNISSSIEDIKTCLTITGADELSLREVNMGYDRIYNLEYFNSLEYMSQTLHDEYNAWKDKWNEYVDDYEKLVLEYQNYYNDIYELKSQKMPEVTGSTDWTEYGLVPLQQQLAAYEEQQAVMIKMGQGNEDHADYNDIYLPCYNAIQAIKAQIAVVENEIKELEAKQAEIGEQMTAIADETSMQNNLSSASLKELAKYIREDELSSDNFIVTDTMTDSERMDMLNEMLKYGQEELAKVSQPVLEFDSDIVNLYNIPEFIDLAVDFEPGNYIHIGIRDDYIIKARILTMDIDWNHPENFSVTFSNIMKLKGSRILSSVNEALDLAQSAATSVSMNSSYWNKANKDSSEIMEMLANGLAAAGQAISTSAADVVVDDRGIIVSTLPEAEYPNDRIFIGGSQILFSDDDFKTIRTALGRLTYEKQGVEYNDFGLMADFVISGYIAGGLIEGTEFNNGNGTFKVDPDGNLTAISATIKGTVFADKGKIGADENGNGGFTIEGNKIYSGNKSTLTSTAAGVYIGTDGISLGSGNVFSVTSAGALTASNVNITGGSLNINNKFIVDKDGTMTATSGSFSGNITGGSISIGDNFSVSNTGILKAKSGTFTGTIDGSDITGGTIEVGALYANDDKVEFGDFYVSANETYKLAAKDASIEFKSSEDPGGNKIPFITTYSPYGGSANLCGEDVRASGSIYGYAFIGDDQNDTYSRFYDILLYASWWGDWTVTKTVKYIWDETIESSDMRLKTNVIDIDNDEALKFILNSRPTTFQYIEDGKWSAGFIAQEVDNLQDKLEIYYPLTSLDRKSEMYKIKYTNYIPLLVSCIQNLQEQINELKSANNTVNTTETITE